MRAYKLSNQLLGLEFIFSSKNYRECKKFNNHVQFVVRLNLFYAATTCRDKFIWNPFTTFKVSQITATDASNAGLGFPNPFINRWHRAFFAPCNKMRWSCSREEQVRQFLITIVQSSYHYATLCQCNLRQMHFKLSNCHSEFAH